MAELLDAARWRWHRARMRLRDAELPVTLLVVAVTMGFVLGLWVGRWWGPEPSEAADRAQLATGQQQGLGARPSREADTGAKGVRPAGCDEVYTAQAPPLSAARPAIGQWEVQIGVMNKLVLGTITPDQVRELWGDTRVGAVRRLAAYAEAQRTLDQATADCPQPAGRMPVAQRACAAEVDARQRELDRAVVVLDAWRTHVEHLEMLTQGEMSPREATQIWLETWGNEGRQVAAYRSAARASDRVAAAHRQQAGGGPCAV